METAQSPQPCTALPDHGGPAAHIAGPRINLTSESAKRLRDGLVAVSGGVLVDHGGAGAGMAEPGHQLFKGCAGGSGEGAFCVPQEAKFPGVRR